MRVKDLRIGTRFWWGQLGYVCIQSPLDIPGTHCCAIRLKEDAKLAKLEEPRNITLKLEEIPSTACVEPMSDLALRNLVGESQDAFQRLVEIYRRFSHLLIPVLVKRAFKLSPKLSLNESLSFDQTLLLDRDLLHKAGSASFLDEADEY